MISLTFLARVRLLCVPASGSQQGLLRDHAWTPVGGRTVYRYVLE